MRKLLLLMVAVSLAGCGAVRRTSLGHGCPGGNTYWNPETKACQEVMYCKAGEACTVPVADEPSYLSKVWKNLTTKLPGSYSEVPVLVSK